MLFVLPLLSLIMNMIELPDMLQCTHEGLPVPFNWSCFHVSQPSHLPLIWLSTTAVLLVVMLKGSITSINESKFAFALATSSVFPLISTLEITGSSVHIVTFELGDDQDASDIIFLIGPSTTESNPNPLPNEATS